MSGDAVKLLIYRAKELGESDRERKILKHTLFRACVTRTNTANEMYLVRSGLRLPVQILEHTLSV